MGMIMRVSARKKRLSLLLFMIATLTLAFILIFKFLVDPNREIRDIENKEFFNFLMAMPQNNGDFTSERLDYTTENGSVDQTFYHLLIQQTLDLDVNHKKIKESFIKQIINNMKSDSYNIKYLSYIVEDNKQFGMNGDLLKWIDNTYEHQLKLKLNEVNIEELYYLSKFKYYKYDVKNNEIMKLLGDFIENEQLDDNIVILSYWYFDLIQLGFGPSSRHNRIINKISELDFLHDNDGKDKDPELVYYFLKIKTDLHQHISIPDHIRDLPDSGIIYKLDSRQIYYILKTKMLLGLENDDKTLFNEYYRVFKPKADNLYPAYVVESNNHAEIMIWDILINDLFKLQDSDQQVKEAILKTILSDSTFTNSTREIYLEVLSCYLNHKNYPTSKVNHFIKLLKNGKSFSDNYYLYQTYHLLSYKLNHEEIEKLRKETADASTQKDLEGIINLLDLWVVFDLDEIYAKDYWSSNLEYLRQEKDNMSLSLYYRFQILNYYFEGKLNNEEINQRFNARNLDNNLIIRGERGEMDLETVYYYYCLKELNEDNREGENDQSSIFLFR